MATTHNESKTNSSKSSDTTGAKMDGKIKAWYPLLQKHGKDSDDDSTIFDRGSDNEEQEGFDLEDDNDNIAFGSPWFGNHCQHWTTRYYSSEEEDETDDEDEKARRLAREAVVDSNLKRRSIKFNDDTQVNEFKPVSVELFGDLYYTSHQLQKLMDASGPQEKDGLVKRLRAID